MTEPRDHEPHRPRTEDADWPAPPTEHGIATPALDADRGRAEEGRAEGIRIVLPGDDEPGPAEAVPPPPRFEVSWPQERATTPAPLRDLPTTVPAATSPVNTPAVNIPATAPVAEVLLARSPMDDLGLARPSTDDERVDASNQYGAIVEVKELERGVTELTMGQYGHNFALAQDGTAYVDGLIVRTVRGVWRMWGGVWHLISGPGTDDGAPR